MLKKLSIITLIAILASCQSYRTKKTEATDVNEVNVQDQAIIEDQPYQIVENEQQANAMNQNVNEGTIEVEKEVEVQDRVHFGYDSYSVDDTAKKILDVQAAWLISNPEIKITIEGHTDERGTREYNIALGERRANSVKQYLVAHGVDGKRMKVVSYGKEKPAFLGITDEIFSKNRRAVVVVND